MAIPDFQTIMQPILGLHEDGYEHASRDIVSAVADFFGLTEEERAERLPSGRQTYIANRVAWAVTHMAQAGLLARTRRGFTRITDRGRKVLADHQDRVDMGVLAGFPEYLEFRSRRRATQSREPAEAESEPETPPADKIPQLVKEAHEVLAQELLTRLREEPPEFLERAVLRLLIKMGYGEALHMGGPGDQGIDGLVRQDPLGLDVVYVQAKRYGLDHVVGRPEVQAFGGAMDGQHADRGVFITTSTFTGEARAYAKAIQKRMILIDGVELTRYMVEYDCGVRTDETFVLKEIDEDFFEES